MSETATLIAKTRSHRTRFQRLGRRGLGFDLSFAVRSLASRPLRSALTLFSILLGVAVILAVSIANESTLASLNTLFKEASGKAHLTIMSSNPDQLGFSQRALVQVSQASGVQAAVPSLQAKAVPTQELTEAEMTMGVGGRILMGGLLLYGVDPAQDLQARDYTIVEGRFLSADSEAFEVVLVENYARENEMRVGRDLELLTPDGVERLRIVGLMAQEGVGRQNKGAFGVTPLAAAQQIFGRVGDLDQIDVIAAQGWTDSIHLDALKADLQSRLGDEYSVTYPASQGERVAQMLDTYQLGLSFFSVVALFVGAFLIYNAFSMTVVERTREIGMLRAIGMTRRQIMRQVLVEAVALGLVGSILGIGAGILLARGLIRFMELALNQTAGSVSVSMPWDGLALSIAIGLLVTLLAAVWPAWQASQTTPLAMVRARGGSGRNWLTDRAWPWGIALLLVALLVLFWLPLPTAWLLPLGSASVFAMLLAATMLIPVAMGPVERAIRPIVQRFGGNEGRLGASNIQRAKARTTLTAAALMVGAAMILGIRGMTDAFEIDLRSWINSYIGGDLYVFSSQPLRRDLGQRIQSVEGVQAVAEIRYVDGNWQDPTGTRQPLTIMAVAPQRYQEVSSFVFVDTSTDVVATVKRLSEGGTVFVSSIIAERFDLQPGDTVRIQTRRGLKDFEVAAIVVDYLRQGQVVHMGWDDLRRWFGLNDVTAFYVKVESGHDPLVVQERIANLYGKSWRLTIDSNYHLKERFFRLLDQLFALFDVLAYIAVIVAAFGIINTLTMTVTERTREIGALRGMGMTRRQVVKMILAEAGIIGLIGGLFGLLFGLFLARVFLMAVNVLRGYHLDFVVPVEGILLTLVLALVISQLAAIGPARHAAGLRIVEAIQYE